MAPKVGIVISTWNRIDNLKVTINGIKEQDYKLDDIFLYIVDNCSSDTTMEYLENLTLNFNWDYRIMPSSDYSAMETLNIGFRGVYGEGCQYILVLDDDVILQDTNTISKLVEVIQSKPQIGMVACNVIGPHEPLPLLEFKFPMNKHINITKLPDHPFRVYDFIGCCALFDMKVFRDIGMYDETFSIYWNEADTALKMLYVGYDVLYEPSISPIHCISQVQRLHKRGWYYYVRNGNKVINRFLNFKNRLVIVPIRSLILLGQGIVYYKDPILIFKVVASILGSLRDIFYMPTRCQCGDHGIYLEVNKSYCAFHWRKFYEWIFRYEVIDLE